MNTQRSKAICILGMHRSGTSAIARTINLLGADLGDPSQLIPAHSDNPEGFWEHAYIVEIHDQILQTLGRSWDSRTPLPDKWWELESIQPFRQKLSQFVKTEFLGQPLWAWKDPRTCLLVPMWQDILQELGVELTYLIVVRNPLDVAASLKKRNDFAVEKSLGIWSLYTLSALTSTHGSKRVIVQYDRFLENWKASVHNVVNNLELEGPEDAQTFAKNMAGFLRPSLRHNRTSLTDLKEAGTPQLVVQTYEKCLEAVQTKDVLDTESFIKSVNALYEEYQTFARMISFEPISTAVEDNSNWNIKVFWPVDGMYSETNAKYLPLTFDGTANEYEFQLPADFDGSLRLDPLDYSTLFRIHAVEVFAERESDSLMILNCSGANGFAGLTLGRGLLKISEDDSALTFIALDEDPQLLVEGLPKVDCATLRLRVVLSTEQPLSHSICMELSKRWTEREQSLRQKDDELINRQDMIRSQELLLEDYRTQRADGERKIDQMNQQISLLKHDLDEEKRLFEELIQSTSWKMTAPLRWFGRLFRRGNVQ